MINFVTVAMYIHMAFACIAIGGRKAILNVTAGATKKNRSPVLKVKLAGFWEALGLNNMP